MDFFDNNDYLTQKSEYDVDPVYYNAQVQPSHMDRFYNAPNSFRGVAFKSVAEGENRPWGHTQPKEYCRKLGAGTFWPMPQIIPTPEKAESVASEWKSEVMSAFEDFAPKVLSLLGILPALIWEKHRDGTLGDMLEDCWKRVVGKSAFRVLFGREASIPEDLGQGFAIWLHHFEGMDDYIINHKGEKRSWPFPVPVYDFTPPRGTGGTPDFKEYQQFCRENKLPFLVPGLNMFDLKTPTTLISLLAYRAAYPPHLFVSQDWNSMQIGRSGRLLLPPYFDDCFINFEAPDPIDIFQPWPDVDELLAGSHPRVNDTAWRVDEVTGRRFYGILMHNPSKHRATLPSTRLSRRSNHLFGYGDGILVMQAQATILRFCAEVTDALRSEISDERGKIKVERLKSEGNKFMMLHPNYPLKSGLGLPGNQEFFQEWMKHVAETPPPTFQSEKQKKDWAEEVNRTKTPLSWLSFQIRLLECTLERSKYSHNHLDSLAFAEPDDRVFAALPRKKDWHLTHVGILRNCFTDPYHFRHFTATYLESHYGNVPESKPPGSTDDDRILPHFSSTEIDAKRELANDTIRRMVRNYVFSAEMWAYIVKTHDEMMPNGAIVPVRGRSVRPSLLETGLYREWHAFLVILRRCTEIKWNLIRAQGIFHGADPFRYFCERKTPRAAEPVDPWKLPSGLMKEPRPDWITPVGLDLEYQDDDDPDPDGEMVDDIKGFLKTLELGPPNIAYGIPSLGLALQHADVYWCNFVTATQGEDGSVDTVQSHLHLEMSQLVSLCSDYITLHQMKELFNDERIIFHQPDLYKGILDREPCMKFMDEFDSFKFEDHIHADLLKDVHLLLGIKYANDPTTEVPLYRAKEILEDFQNSIEDWMRRSPNQPTAYFEAMEDARERIYEEKLKKKEDPPGAMFPLSDHFGPITTIDSDRMDVVDDAPESLPSPTDAPEVIPVQEDIEVIQIPTRGDIEREEPDEGNTNTTGQRPLIPNLNHAAGGRSSARAHSKLSNKHWATVEALFGRNGGPPTRTSVKRPDVMSLLERLDFKLDPTPQGSRYLIEWTDKSKIPKPEKTTITIHVPHKKGKSSSKFEGNKLTYLRSDLTALGITAGSIEAHYGEGAGTVAMEARLVNLNGDDENEDEDVVEAEEEDEEKSFLLKEGAPSRSGKRKERDEDGESDWEEVPAMRPAKRRQRGNEDREEEGKRERTKRVR